MYKRLLAAGLWLLAALYAGSMLHAIIGVHELVGPVIGLMSASLIVVDPFHRLGAEGFHEPAQFPAPIEPEVGSDEELSEAA